LLDPASGAPGSNFDKLEFRDTTGPASARLGSTEFVRLMRFVRLWKKTGWTIEHTDAAICALYRPDLTALTAGDVDIVAKLDAGFLTLLPRLGVAVRVIDVLGATGRNKRMEADIGDFTHSAEPHIGRPGYAKTPTVALRSPGGS
jgi:hypothetical protein